MIISVFVYAVLMTFETGIVSVPDLRILHVNKMYKLRFMEIFMGESKFVEILWILKTNNFFNFLTKCIIIFKLSYKRQDNLKIP